MSFGPADAAWLSKSEWNSRRCFQGHEYRYHGTVPVLQVLASHEIENAAELDCQTMQRILAFPGDLWLDVYGDDLDN